MENSKFSEIPNIDVAEGSETAIEIKIKTLDSQTYTLKVNKQVSVPALKEQIASVTGVLSEQQRLICRGKVLKDDQLLSAYHVEDGHTLHLVVRQPIPPSSESGSSAANDPSFGNRGSTGHLSPSVVIETFSVPDQGGEGVPREISRIVSAVLGSFGLSNFGSSTEGRSDRTSGATNASNSNQPQSEQPRGPSERWPGAFGLPAAVSLGMPPVLTDSLVTMSQYLNHMRRDFSEMVHGSGNDAQAAAMDGAEGRESNSAHNPFAAREGLPTPAALAELMTSTRQMLVEQIADCLQTFTSELENQANITDPTLRTQAQDRAMRIGMSILYLGAYILELGRTVMTLRFGQNPSEAVVNAGPAIYISPSGPNPLMVQPLPFQMGSSFGSIPIPTHQSPGFGGASYLPRRIDIQIRRGTSNATANANSGAENQQQPPVSRTAAAAANSGAENPLDPLTSGVRVVPIRTMMAAAAVPASFGHLPADSIDPLLNPNVTVQATTGSRGGNENATSAGEPQSYQEQGRQQMPGSIYQLLRSLFPGGEIVVEEASFIGAGTEAAATGFVSQNAEMSAPPAAMDAPEAAPDGGATSDGIFLSNLLRQIMPLISQHSGEEPRVSEPRTDQDSSFQAGSSGCSEEDPDSVPPSSKRQKRE